MEYIDGVTLKEELKSRKRFDFDDLFEPLVPLLRALGKIHYYYVGACGCGERRPSGK